MSLLDPDIKTIIGTKWQDPNLTWTQKWIKGTEEIVYELKDQQGNFLGKFHVEDKNTFLHNLNNSDGTILFRFTHSGTFTINVHIKDSKNNLLGKTSVYGDLIFMNNSNNEKILEHKFGFTKSVIRDNNENNIAELKTKIFKIDWTLNILDSHFDRKMILGFLFALVIINFEEPSGGGGGA